MTEKEFQQQKGGSAEDPSINKDEDINVDENVAGTSHLSEAVGEESGNEKLVQKLNEEVQDQKDKYLRLYAEFDNFKRRSAKERVELMQTAGREVIQSLLDVLDDCDRAEKQLDNPAADIASVREGVLLVFNKLRGALQSKGLKAMESIHTPFDVEKHDAITEIPAPAEKLKGKVLDEVQKGYYLGDKLIRHAKVVVGK
jgi:molecular chaperone GrpE